MMRHAEGKYCVLEERTKPDMRPQWVIFDEATMSSLFCKAHLANMKQGMSGQGYQIRVMQKTPATGFTNCFTLITSQELPHASTTDSAAKGENEDWNAINDRTFLVPRGPEHRWKDDKWDYPITAKLLARYVFDLQMAKG